MSRLLISVFSTLFISLAAAQDTWCAFEVKVSTPSGSPVAEVPVALIRERKTTFSQTTTDANGMARLCDAPLENVDIFVGFDRCNSVLVGSLAPTWPDTQRIFVTYVKTFCGFVTLKPDCQVLLRIQDEEGRAVAGARFDGKSSSSSGFDVSDVFGRLYRSLKTRDKLVGIVTRAGSQPARISVKCEDDTELKVVLHKR
jgi:hypothetical protein